MESLRTYSRRGCYVCGHSRGSASAKGLHFHKMPSSVATVATRDEWLRFLHLPPSAIWPTQQWRGILLCSLHFRETDYHPDHLQQIRPLLVPGSIPTQKQPTGPGDLGSLFSLTSTESSCLEGQLVEGAESLPSTSTPVEENTFEEESLCTTSQVHASSNSADPPQRGAISKFRSGCNLKRMMGLSKGKPISPRSDRMYTVAKYFRTRFQRQVRKQLFLPASHSENPVIERANLPAEVYSYHLENLSKFPQSRRYSDRIKALSLALQGRSARAYRLFSQLFTLPSSRTLKRTRQSISLNTGISEVVLNCMLNQLSTMSEIDKICVVMFDEMSLKKHLEYDSHEDHILGYQDVGGSRSPLFADHSLVFMVRGLVSEWKQPVAFHLGQAIKRGNLENAIKETVVALQGIGLKVMAIVCDLAQSNVSALNSLATQTFPERDDPIIKIGGDKIFIFADPPHLLKVLRNNFLKYDIQFKGRDGQIKIAKFNILKELLEYEKKQPESLIYPHKLSDRHLNPSSKELMRVKYAAQLFSVSVSRELSLYAARTGNRDAHDLAEFILTVDKLFDSFNSFSANDVKQFRVIVTSESRHHIFWTEMRQILKDWKFVVRSPCTTKATSPKSQCFFYWQRNILAVQSLWKEVMGLGVRSLKTKNINQDSLESFFGTVRQQGDCNTNPSSSLFLNRFKNLMLKDLSINLNSKRGNVLQCNVALLSDLLSSKSEDRGRANLLDPVANGVGHASSSLSSLCSVSKEVEACTSWINRFSCTETMEGELGFAKDLLSSFLRQHTHYRFISSCFSCFQCFYHCNHPDPSPGKVTCDKCTSLNSSLALQMFKMSVFVLKELQNTAHESRLSETLKRRARVFPLQALSCGEHKDDLHSFILPFIVRYAIRKFCSKVNYHLDALARKTKPHK